MLSGHIVKMRTRVKIDFARWVNGHGPTSDRDRHADARRRETLTLNLRASQRQPVRKPPPIVLCGRGGPRVSVVVAVRVSHSAYLQGF